MNNDVALLKRRFLQMAVADGLLVLAAAGFAYAYFGAGVSWALYAFVGFLGAAFLVQMWFIRGVTRGKRGG